MKKKILSSFSLILLLFMMVPVLWAQPTDKVDTRVDCQAYWKKMAAAGLVTLNPDVQPPAAVPVSNFITAPGILSANSPDVAIDDTGSIQSENSIFINSSNFNNALNSNNSSDNPKTTFYGTSSFTTTDGGLNWGGSVLGAGGNNSGDPTTAIDNSGRFYIGYIASGFNQGISYSTDAGSTWTAVSVATSSALLDKNHLWVDNSTSSTFDGNLYNAWTSFGGTNNNQIELTRSTNGGLTWSAPISISNGVSAGNHNQGVHLQTGPAGQVYACWAIYDSWPSDESAIGFARSTNGGVSFTTATRAINNIRGIRNTTTGKNHRQNSFPVMACDISGGPHNGNLYIVWSNIGVPGVNTGSDADVYMIKSTNNGTTWSTPVKINQDASGLGKKHYFPWITCDPVTGHLHVVFYDDRNVSATQCEVFVASSLDGGSTWTDFRVSDVAFTPAPIPGMAPGYMGDYLGIAAYDNKVYPVWTDNRTGAAMAYTSPFVVSNCDDNVILQNITVASGVSLNHQANLTIEAAGGGTFYNINSGGSSTMIAGNSVKLLTGFHAQAGSSFKAKLGSCTLSPVKRARFNDSFAENDPSELIEFQVYPNPNAGYFSLDVNITGEDSSVDFAVFSLMGKLVHYQKITASGTIDIDISNQPPGVYIGKIVSNNKEISEYKIVYQK